MKTYILFNNGKEFVYEGREFFDDIKKSYNSGTSLERGVLSWENIVIRLGDITQVRLEEE